MNGGNKKNQSALMRFVGNKNVVTILGILVCIAILVVGYAYRVNNSVATSSVPFAKKELKARDTIEAEDVGNVRISSGYLSTASNVITEAKSVYNKKVAYYTNIPAGSLFYSESVMDPEKMPNYAFEDIGDNKTIYSLAVDASSTYSNSIRAGDYIDLYLSATDPNNTDNILFGCFIESIRVLAVKDDSGNNILKNSLDNGSPAELLFAVDDEYYLLLKDAEFLDIDLIPVLHNKAYSESKTQSSTKVSSEILRAVITSQVKEF